MFGQLPLCSVMYCQQLLGLQLLLHLRLISVACHALHP